LPVRSEHGHDVVACPFSLAGLNLTRVDHGVNHCLRSALGEVACLVEFLPNVLLRRISMTKLLAASRNFVRDEDGASLVEYGLLLALIAVVCIGAVAALGSSISTMLNSLAGSI
jgi:pilus assembly protein Flp/PilA